MMQHRHPWLALSLATALLCAASPAPADHQTLTLTLPLGDPQAGRSAFLELGCSSCHRVTGERDLPMPVSAHPGPFLGSPQANWAAGALASAIAAPSHQIGEAARRNMEGELSPMGDFSHAMTVRQLADLVAYLQSVGRHGAG